MQILRATRIPGEGTLWTRTLERFLGQEPGGQGGRHGAVARRAPPAPAPVLWAAAGMATARQGRLLRGGPAPRQA